MPVKDGWAIVGKRGLYVGWWMTRADAIRDHVSDKLDVGEKYGRLTDAQKAAWQECRRAGDRAVRISIKYDKE